MSDFQLPLGGYYHQESGVSDVQLPSGGFVNEPVDPNLILVPLATLVLTKFNPAVLQEINVSVPLSTLTLTAFEPTLVNLLAAIPVPASNLTITAYAPTVSSAPPPPPDPIVPLEFATWAKQDNADRVIVVEVDYMREVGGEPFLDTLRLATKLYVDNESSPPKRYRACLDAKSPLLFSRSLTGPTLGNYNSSLGSIEINNENGEYDFVLKLALDNSDVRVYMGAVDWLFSDFRQLFSALSVRADAPSTARISIMLKDASALLNKSIGGEILVGGTGSSAQKFRPANVGLVFQVPCEVLDPIELQYVHSDRGGVGGTALQMYDRGIEITFLDNGDGTGSLAFPPDGQVTADVLSISADSPSNSDAHRVSDAFFQIVGDRCGMSALGRYYGAGPTFTVGDSDDYPIGISIASAENVARSILPELAQTGNCFWTILRLGSFSFGRLQPQDIEGLGLTPVKIRKDDIDDKTLRAVKIADPTYYRLQCLVNKNWYVASDVAAAVDPDRQNLLRSDGLVLQQNEAVGTTYADAPELYDRSLAVSPVLPTLLSVDPASASPDPATVAETWMERQRFMYLPWLEGISFRCGIEFFELELGDVVELTVDRFGCDAGELFQVIGVSLMPVLGKMELTLLRRLTAETIPDDWTRVTEETDLSFRGAVIIPPKPPLVPPGPPQPPFFYIPSPMGGIRLSTNLCGIDPARVERSPGTPEYNRYFATASPSAPDHQANDRIAITPDGTYMVVGDPGYNVDGTNFGIVKVFKRGVSDPTYTEIATLQPPSGTWFAFGGNVAVTAELDIIVVVDDGSSPWWVFELTAPDTWDTGTSFGPQAGGPPHWLVASKYTGDRRFIIQNGNNAEVWKRQGLGWALIETIIPPVRGGVGGEFVAATMMQAGGAGRYIACLTDSGATAGTWVDVYQTNDFITWNLQQSISIGIGESSSGFNAIPGIRDKIVMSYDGRVVAVSLSGIFRAGVFVSGVYVLQAPGTALYPIHGASPGYVQTALITGESVNNSSFGFSMAISEDGQFLVIGQEGHNVGSNLNVGRVHCINRLQELSGEYSVVSGLGGLAFRLSNPNGTTADLRYGGAVAMNSNGCIVAVQNLDWNDDGTLMVTVHELNMLDIPNDAFADAIDLSTFSSPNILSTAPWVKLISASREPGEPDAGGYGESLQRTVWYKITPVNDALFNVDTLLSLRALDPFYPSGTGLDIYRDTILTVYEGTVLDALTLVANSDDDGATDFNQCDIGLSQLIGVFLTAGTTYYIQVGWYRDNGVVNLRLRFKVRDLWARQHMPDRPAFGFFNEETRIAMDSTGTYAVIANRWENETTNPSLPGSVVVYKNTGGTWAELTTLEPATPGPFDNEDGPYAVAIADDLTIVATTDGALGVGFAEWQSTGPDAWGTPTRFDPTITPTEGSKSMTKIWISRDSSVVVGMYDTDNISVFTGGPGAWTQKQCINASDITGGFIVYAVAVSSDGSMFAVLSGSSVSPNNTQVDVFSTSDFLTWTITNTIGPIPGSGNGGVSQTGLAMTPDGLTIAVGCNQENSGDGAVHVFDLVSGSYVERCAITGMSGLVGGFGVACAISDDGNILAVGAPFTVDGSNFNVGGLAIIPNLNSLSGSVSAADYFYPNPYPNERNNEWGLSLCISGDGSTIGVMGEQSNDVDAFHVDFMTAP